MLCNTNTTLTTPSGSTTYVNSDALLGPNQLYLFPWIATWRNNGANAGATIFDEAVRTSTTCYMRGLKEKIRLSTNDGSQWLWRRICFTTKGDNIHAFAVPGYNIAKRNDVNGFQRLVNDVYQAAAGTGGANVRDEILDAVFKGTKNIDWSDVMTAPVDTRRVTVYHDKTTQIASGNQNGKQIVCNRWHPMNKNLVYDDEQDGESTDPYSYSVVSKQGMGDYYVIDMIRSAVPQGTGSALAFTPEATLYWHEK